ncbi:PKD domain-containing protein, partial [Fulvivirga sp. RKSG066]|uniref:PKD domain-containing protein n=1 Tax=Fulvivirga aurantia TaxID=2529383 RepID=UPI0012BBE802
EVNIIPDSFFLKCSDPDSLLTTEIVQGGTGPITYAWSTGATTPDININTAGFYYVFATDSIGCDYSDVINVNYPLVADLQYTPFCENGDIVNFTDQSIAYTNSITDYSWNFGDPASGADNTSIAQNPSHEFTVEGDYTVTLQIEDDDGCISTTSTEVYNTAIDNFFEINPPEKELCLGELINATGPGGVHIDEHLWNFGDGQTRFGSSLNYQYQTPGNYDISLDVIYNSHPDASDACYANFNDGVEIFPLPEITIESSAERYCVGEEVSFSFTSSKPIQYATWTFTNLRSNEVDISNQLTTDYTFAKRANYNIKLEVIDNNGCSSQTSFNQFADRIVIPDFETELNICAKQFITLTEAFRDSLENITDYHWDFGDGYSEAGQMPISLTNHKFARGGSFPVTLNVSNSFSGCENSITKMVNILAPPQIDFSYDTICARSIMPFTNNTQPGDGEIESYQWIFPDGSTSSDLNTQHYFDESGSFPVSLISTSTLGCADTLTRQVYVKETPTAGIGLQEGFIEAFLPVQFFDDSQGDIVSYFWDFGDGAFSYSENPTHTYDAIERYRLSHAVVNTVGCSDTTTVDLDLNVYLELPNAFSPNNDGKNDELGLIQQGIKTLHEFKIFNRNGQIIFDATGNIEKRWEGSHNGQIQPAGVYVCYVKASGAYGKEFNFKQNITLLR